MHTTPETAIAAWNARAISGKLQGPHTLIHNDMLQQLEARSARLTTAEARAEEAERKLADFPRIKEQANAWEAVFDLLDMTMPDFSRLGSCGLESALEAIRKLVAAESENARLKGEIAEVWSLLSGWDARRITEGSGEPARNPGAVLLASAKHVKAEVSRLKGELDELRTWKYGQDHFHGCPSGACLWGTLVGPVEAQAEIDRLKAEVAVGVTGSPFTELIRAACARISELENNLTAINDQGKIRTSQLDEANQRISELERERDTWRKSDAAEVHKHAETKRFLFDALLVIGALGLRPAAGGLHCKGVVYPGQLVMDAFERLGGKGEK